MELGSGESAAAVIRIHAGTVALKAALLGCGQGVIQLGEAVGDRARVRGHWVPKFPRSGSRPSLAHEGTVAGRPSDPPARERVSACVSLAKGNRTTGRAAARPSTYPASPNGPS